MTVTSTAPTARATQPNADRASDKETRAHARETPAARREILVAVLGSGAVVMLVEILGTRIIGPVFGVSLFVWAALLAVTLGALAVGYYAGGVIVDRQPRVQLLGVVLLVSGALLAFVPLLEHLVLSSTTGLGPRGGPLVAALLLFAPALLTLGMTGPIAVRLETTDVGAAGHRVGAVYAVSTAGSLAGTLATSFWIIPRFETDQILFGAATLTILLGGLLLARRGHPISLVAIALPVLSNAVAHYIQPALPEGITIRARAQSPYGLVEVIDDASRRVRFLRADHSVVGAHFFSGPAAFAFLHQLEVVRFLRPSAHDMLVLGLGTGALPTELSKRGIETDVVEIDPVVAQFARDFFGFRTQGTTFVEDARTFLGRTKRQYDIVVHDTFTGGATPEHLLSLQVVREIHRLLRPGGLLALNFAGFESGPNAEASLAVARTLKAEFPSLRVFRDRAPDDDPSAASNLIFLASDGDLTLTIPSNATFDDAMCEHAIRSLPQWEVLKQIPAGQLITDEKNPLARLEVAAAEDHFSAMQRLLPAEVWLQ